MTRWQLPYSYKNIGLALTAMAILALIGTKIFWDERPEGLKLALNIVLVLGMLIISLAKEKVEDELMQSLRTQSYRWAFVTGVVYALVQPWITVGVSSLLGSSEHATEMGAFQLLFFMLFVQLLSFWNLKRTA
ncbi:hypothetical protein B7P33_10615 [Sediminicola luteus]|uniref:Uncharacterized protein n=2 Tax=Sediminicola luteus TaxID=319238 RepID=A0A2A4G6X1_9FLAO|nr:hypothetical protein B7P33_10615 [Sediminicola luteus]